MTFQSYLMFVATQPLLLRLLMVAVIATLFLAIQFAVERILDSRQKRRVKASRAARPERQRQVLSAAWCW